MATSLSKGTFEWSEGIQACLTPLKIDFVSQSTWSDLVRFLCLMVYQPLWTI